MDCRDHCELRAARDNSGRHDAAERGTAALVGLYIGAAYWFTASTSFANPAVTIARMLTDSFAGIRPLDVPAFMVAQVAGAVLAAFCVGWLMRSRG